MRDNLLPALPSWKPHKYGLILLLIKLIIWHGYICTCHPGTTNVYGTTYNECNATCVSPQTFYGSASSAIFRRATASNFSNLTFSIRTRSSNGLVLASDANNTHFIAIGLNGGKINISYRYSLMEDEQRIEGAMKINDGNWHNISVTSVVNTSIAVDQVQDVEKKNTQVLNDHFKALVEAEGVTVGNNSKWYLASLFTVSYFEGCFDRLSLGEDLLKHYSSVGLGKGCYSDAICASSPCVKGTCVDTLKSYRCDCQQFYSGVNCNLTHNVACAFKADLCNVGRCENLTTPVEPVYSQSGKDYFQCHCNNGYSGYLCNETIDYCNPNPCANGVCTSSVGDYICNCTSGYTGRNCTVNVNECNSSPCQNGGTCTSSVGSYTCNCTSGYTGRNCTVNVKECNSSPCQNGGTCTSSVGSYTCNCTSGYTGRNCTVNVNECNSSPCQNGGTCQDGVNGFVCKCGSGYKGETCQVSESSTNVAMWVGIGIGILVVILIILFLIVRYCMGSSGLSGSYSPTGQEKGQVQMTSMPPIPPKERLI